STQKSALLAEENSLKASVIGGGTSRLVVARVRSAPKSTLAAAPDAGWTSTANTFVPVTSFVFGSSKGPARAGLTTLESASVEPSIGPEERFSRNTSAPFR